MTNIGSFTPRPQWVVDLIEELSGGGGGGGGGGSSAWGDITGTLSAQTDLQTALDAKQPLSAGATKNGFGTATIDFGAFPGSNEASVTFSDTNVGAAVHPFFASNDTTSDHTANDHKYAAMLIHLSTEATAGVGGVIYARSEHKMQGTFDVRYGY